MKKKNSESKQSGTTTTGTDTVAAIQQVARAMPAAVAMTKTQLDELRAIERRAPAKFLALVLSEAEESGGNVAGVAIDPAASRNDVAQASSLRVGAAAARSIARRLEQEATVLASGVAQRALSATASLQAYARTPEGRSLAAKAAELRTAARGTKRTSTAKPKATKKVATAVAAEPPVTTATETATTAPEAPAQAAAPKA